MNPSAHNVHKKPLGVFESLASGFELIWFNPWILLVPITLDLFLWWGPQLSARPVFQRTIALLQLLTPAQLPDDTRQNIELLERTLQTAGDTTNVFGMLATGMPTVIGLQPPAVTIPRVEFIISDPLMLLGITLALLIGAVFIAGVYLELVARPIRSDAAATAFITDWLRACVQLILLALVVSLGLVVLMIPVTLVASVLGIVNQTLGTFFMMGGTLLIFVVLLYLFFAVPAIFISRVNALQAILHSISIFRFAPLPAVTLVFIIYLLRSGFTIVWQLFDLTMWGIVFVVIAHAFLSSALIAAQMIFYNNRVTLWRAWAMNDEGRTTKDG